MSHPVSAWVSITYFPAKGVIQVKKLWKVSLSRDRINLSRV
uniref:Uncharacterized protein n=1 Tax=Siphoviridae sp. cttFh17 TaxID=2826491 RepID=A0A8S5NJZ9_9CAUD|nr:MAG TPA: hypothetical protein [Siphoviridae sp. cttFh17]